MEDGEEQQKRDEIFLSQLGKELKGAFPSRWYVAFLRLFRISTQFLI